MAWDLHPQYKLTNLPPTPVETLERAQETSLEERVSTGYLARIILIGRKL